MGVGPLVTGEHALILEYSDVFEARIFFQVGDSGGPDPQDALDLFVAELRHAFVVIGRFDDHLVRAEGAHFVVHAFGEAAGFTLDAVERIGMGQDAHLPRTFGGPSKDGRLLLDNAAVERAWFGGVVQMFALPQDYPALRDWISSNFHAEFWFLADTNTTRGCKIVGDHLDHAQ
jgi:hypothetical protein